MFKLSMHSIAYFFLTFGHFTQLYYLPHPEGIAFYDPVIYTSTF